jgi:hypothetical protein
MRELNWNRATCTVSLVLRRLQKQGLVERVRWPFGRRAGRPLPRPIGYQITAAGKRAWAESADFYLYFVKRYGNPARPKAAAAPAMQRAALAAPPDGPDRRPTDAEAKILLAASPPWLARICRAVWGSPLSLEVLVGLDVSDVDLARGIADVADAGDRRPVRMGPKLRGVVSEAIGRRREGPMFANVNGDRLPFRRVLKAFKRVRDRLGISPCVKLRGRMKRQPHRRDEAA